MAWFLLCLAFCAHVADEALTGFLPIYNATVLAMRSQYQWYPMPTFRFRDWLTGLIVANIVLLLLTPFAFRNAWWLRPFAYVYAGVHFLNAMGHTMATIFGQTVSTIRFARPAPGFYSSPLLLAGSIYLLTRLRASRRNQTRQALPEKKARGLRGTMRRISFTAYSLSLAALLAGASANFHGQSNPATKEEAPLRVALAGLVHGHAFGFFDQFQKRPDLQIVGIAESNGQLVAQFEKRYGLAAALFYSDLEEMLKATHPQAVLAYTSTYDHRSVVEICARYGVHVMMEKPLAVSLEDARAIEKAARAGKIQVLVNYETTWYRSNQAAYDLAHEKALGEIRKIVVHDGHSGPKEIGVGPEFLAWLTDPKLNGGGALFDFGCYGADLATWLMDGRRPNTVTAVTQRIKPDVYPRVDDEATIILTYPNAQAIVQASWNWPFSRKDMEVYGQKGYAITVGRDAVRVRLPEKEEILADAKLLEKAKEDSVSYLRAVLLGGRRPEGPSSLETNVIVTEILEAARLSAATGKTVVLAGKQ